MQIVSQTWLNLVTLTCVSWSEGQHDLYFTVQWFCLISWRLFDVCTSYFRIMNQYDPRSLWLYFMVQWFCLVFWRLFDVWKSLLGILNLYDPTFDLKIFHAPVILRYILKTIWFINIILWDYGSVWPNIWPQNKCISLWPIFHGPVILPYVSKTIWWMSVIFSDNETGRPKLCPNIGQHDLYFMV